MNLASVSRDIWSAKEKKKKVKEQGARNSKLNDYGLGI